MIKRKLKLIIGILTFCGMLSLIGFKVNAAENSNYYNVNNETLQEYAFNDIQFSISRAYGDRFVDWYGVEYVERNVFTPNSSSVVVYEAVEEANSYYLNIWNNSINYEDYPTVSKLNNATALYNCHSYAWYLMNSSNIYWMDEPDLYYEDASYYEVTTPRIGDKICYYDNTGYNLHSGIVIDTLPGESNNVCGDSNLVTVISKWGRLGLFEHRGDDCVYTEIHGGDAAYVKYYRPRTNNTYTLTNNISTINNSLTIDSNTQKIYSYEMYELNIKDSGSFELNISSTSNLDVRLYDEHMQLVEYDNLSMYSNTVRFVKDFIGDKKYYLRVAYNNDSSIGTIFTYIQEACSGCDSLYRDKVALNCQTEPYEDSLYLQQNQTIIYELDLECDTRYDFEVESPNLLSVGLYDENMTLVSDFLYFQGTNNNYYYFNVQDLEEGRYHIKVNLASGSSSCNINVTLDHRPTSPEEILVNEPVDVLEHLHYSSNAYYFMRNKPGIYEVVLTGISSNGTIIYPEGTITIVSGDNIVQKYVFTEEDYDNPATSLNGSNIMTWLVDDYANYYIIIEISSTGLTSLQLEVRELETFTLSASDEFSEISQLVNGDKFEILDVERTGEYNVQATYTGSQTDDMLFVILRKNSDGLFEEVDGGLFNNTTNFETDVLLNTGEQIYIGYFNGNGNGTFSLNIERNVSNTFSLMTDPNGNVTVGSEVSLNNGEYGGTTLTQGYTRIIYLGIDAPYIQSRTQYNWYTTDSSVAIVSAYGTVTATATWTGSQTSKTVVIRAVYKSNPTIVGEITLTVYKETNTAIEVLTQYGMDVRGDGSQGTEVTVLHESPINIGVMPDVEIHKGYTRYICLGSDSPSNIIQHFTWSIDRQDGETGNATVSQYGVIKGTTEGYITIKGVYKYNPRYVIYITVKVL